MDTSLHSYRAVCAKMFDDRSAIQNAQNRFFMRERRIKFFQQISSDCSYSGKQKRRDIIRRPFTGNLVPFHASVRLPPETATVRFRSTIGRTAIDVSKTNYIQHLSVFCYVNSRA